MTFREHFLRIFRYSRKSLWLLIFPLLRGVSVMHFDPAGIYAWIRGAWMDIAVLGVILIYGIIRWRFSQILINEDSLTMKEGVFIRIERTIPFKSLSSASIEMPFYLVPLRAVRVRCDTRAGIFRSTDLKLMVTPKAAEAIIACVPDVKTENAFKDLPKPNIASILMFSVFFSSGFTGTVYIAAFFIKGGDIARDLVQLTMNRITEQAEHIYARLLSGIPKAAAMAAMFFVGAWLLSFIMNLLRYARFRLSADREQLNVSFGLIKRRTHRIRIKHINCIDLRQNLIMKLFKVVTVNISCPGYGNASHLPVLIPICSESDLGINRPHLGVGSKRMTYCPKWSSFLSYAGLPFISVVIVTVLFSFSDKLPQLADLSLFLVVMADIPLAWLTMVKTAALGTSGVTIHNDKVVIRCSKWTSFHTVITRHENVALVQVKQTIMQKPFGKCTVILWLSGESSSRYKIYALSLKDGMEIAEKLGKKQFVNTKETKK